MPASEPGLRRVSVHAGTAVVDLALPAGIPVAVLIPSIVDMLDGIEGFDACEPRRYELSRPGTPALAASTTLADNAIRDGAVLVLGRPPTPFAAPRYDDAAQAVSATLAAATPSWKGRGTRLAGAIAAAFLTGTGGLVLIRNAFTRNGSGTAGVAACAALVALLFAVMAHRTFRDAIAGLALGLMATVFAAVAGFLAVPGIPGIPNALLAATAAAATSVFAMRASACGAVTFTAVSCGAAVVAAAALAGMMTSAPLETVGSVTVLVSLGLLGVAARMSIALAGLSPQLARDPDDIGADCFAARAIRADSWLASLLAAFSSSAAIGAVLTVLAGAPRLSCIAFGALTGALLLLRSRCNDVRRALVFVIGGLAITATTFGAAAMHAPQHAPWIAAGSAALAAAAMCLGFVVPALSFSPVAHRSVELLESSALVAMVPLTCWVCGLYGAVRGLILR
ncbi:MAG TPA: type VII secretion integral membrane protein EccD [Mycobacterium sp.]|nr:type VII secretion integral membrane protein EccD [Mycobacterium sp.]